jgi:hypothetical protein
MSMGVTLDRARELERGLVIREQARHGGDREQARARLARRMGVLPGTLYNLARARLKRLDDALRAPLVSYAVHDLQLEIERLNHELEVARELGAAPGQDLVREIEATLKRAQDLYDAANAAGCVS